MNKNNHNTLLPEDELQAALAEIENLAPEQVTDIPSLDADEPDDGDGAQQTARSAAEANDAALAGEDAGNVASEDVSFADIEQQAAAEAEVLAAKHKAQAADGGSAAIGGAESVPPSGSPDASNASVDSGEESGAQDDLVAALAEVQASGTRKKQEPRPAPQVAVPDHDLVESRASSKENSGGAGTPPGADSGGRRFRFQIGKKEVIEEQPDVADYRPPEERGASAATVPGLRPTTPLAKRIYRLVDRWLDMMNQPFSNLDGMLKAAIGMVAVTTVIISVLAILLMPVILPHRDAVVFLQEKVQTLHTPAVADEVVPEASESDAK